MLLAGAAVAFGQDGVRPGRGPMRGLVAEEKDGVAILANNRIEVRADMTRGLTITSVRALPDGENAVNAIDLTFPISRKGNFEAQRSGKVRDCTHGVRNGKVLLEATVECRRYTVRETIAIGKNQPWATVTCTLEIREPPTGNIVCPILFLNDAHRTGGFLHDLKVGDGFRIKRTAFMKVVRLPDCGHLLAPLTGDGPPLLAFVLPTLPGYEPGAALYEGFAYPNSLFVRRQIDAPKAGDTVTWTYHILALEKGASDERIVQSVRQLVPGTSYETGGGRPFALKTGSVPPYTNIVAGRDEDGFVLARGGKPQCGIVIPTDANIAEETVAGELAADLGTIIGSEPAVKRETDATAGSAIYIGRTRPGRDLIARRLASESSDGAFCLQVAADRICAVGRTDVATSYAADRLLESIGVRRFHADPLGTIMPSLPDLAIRAIELLDRPALPFRAFGRRRGGNAVRCPIKYPRPMAARAGQAKWSGHAFYWMTHSEDYLMPAAEYFEKHPDYYALLGGERADERKKGVRAHLCTTNPDVSLQFARNVAAYHLKYPFLRLFMFFADDYAFGYCGCPTCRARYGPGTASYARPFAGRHSDLWHDFIGDVAKHLKKLAPRVVAGSAAYQTYQLPPESRHYDRDNAIYLAVMQNEDVGRAINDPNATANLWRHRILKEWCELASPRICYMYYDKHIWFNLPNPTYRKAAHDWRQYRSMGIDGCTSQWSSSHKFIFPAVRKLLWNPDYDVDLMLDDYCAKMYGGAAPMVREYYERMEQGFLGKEVILNADAYALQVFTPGLMGDCRKLIDQARAAHVADPDCKKRLDILADSFAYYELVVAVLSAARDVQLKTSPGRAGPLAARAETALGALEARYQDLRKKAVPLTGVAHRAVLGAYTPMVRSALKIAKCAGDKEAISVPKLWKFRLDPQAVGLARNWQSPTHDDRDWRTIPIGVPWEKALGKPYDGVAWYRVSITPPAALKGKTVRIYFGGVDGQTTVYLNGELIGENMHWNQDFEFDVSKKLKYGRNNVIAVRVHDLANAGGIYRPVLFH